MKNLRIKERMSDVAKKYRMMFLAVLTFINALLFDVPYVLANPNRPGGTVDLETTFTNIENAGWIVAGSIAALVMVVAAIAGGLDGLKAAILKEERREFKGNILTLVMIVATVAILGIIAVAVFDFSNNQFGQ